MKIRTVAVAVGLTVTAAAHAENVDVGEMLKAARAEADGYMTDASLIMDARQISQAIGVAEACEINLDLEKVAEIAGSYATLGNPTARLMFQSGGRTQQMRFKEMTAPERAAACGEARATAQKHNFLN